MISNDDPDKKGRVRVKIPGVLDFDDPEHYPWCIPDWEHADGSTDYSGKFDVPKINAFVGVFFQTGPNGEGSIYHPVYMGYHVFDTTMLEDSKHHYPNRKVSRMANGSVLIIDTKDDSFWLYNPGESHVKSKGKLTIKCEETFVLISDVEIGLRAPEIFLRALKHLIMESEDKLTIRSKGLMNIESRDDIWMLARRNIDMIAAEEQVHIYARGDTQTGGADGLSTDAPLTGQSPQTVANVIIHSAKDNVRITADGDEMRRRSNVEITARQHDVRILAEARYMTETSLIDMRARKDTITIEAEGINSNVDRSDVLMRSRKHDVTVQALGENALQRSDAYIIANKNNVSVLAKGSNSPLERSDVFVSSRTHDVNIKATGEDLLAKSRVLITAEKNSIDIKTNASNWMLEDDANINITSRVYDIRLKALGAETVALRQPEVELSNLLGPLSVTATKQNLAAAFPVTPILSLFGMDVAMLTSEKLVIVAAPELQIATA